MLDVICLEFRSLHYFQRDGRPAAYMCCFKAQGRVPMLVQTRSVVVDVIVFSFHGLNFDTQHLLQHNRLQNGHRSPCSVRTAENHVLSVSLGRFSWHRRPSSRDCCRSNGSRRRLIQTASQVGTHSSCQALASLCTACWKESASHDRKHGTGWSR